MPLDEASTRFLDGMRVATEHMRHLQGTSIDAVRQLRAALGTGKVSHGFEVTPSGAGISVSPGLAIDGFGRPIVLDAAQTIAIGTSIGTDRAWLVASYDLRSSLLVGGVPTLLANGVKLEARATAPPYADGAVPFAEINRAAAGLQILQRGEWYLPPLDHGHSGEFFTDAAGRRRFDGKAIGGSTTPQFDSGFVALAAGATLTLAHGLKSVELAVELSARRSDGVITNRGVGSDFWFELGDEDHVTLARGGAADAPALDLRVRIWRPGASAGEVARPIADAGDDTTVELGQSFHLDAGRSRAPGVHHLVRYLWTQLS